MLTHDVVYIQGYDFGRELLEDDFTPALLEAQALRAHMKAKGSKKPYAILGYRGDVVGPPADSKLPQYAADPRYRHFWLTDDKGAHHDCGPADPHHINPSCGPMWDFRNASAREYLATEVAGFFGESTGLAVHLVLSCLSSTSSRASFRAHDFISLF